MVLFPQLLGMISTAPFWNAPTQEKQVPRSIPMAGPILAEVRDGRESHKSHGLDEFEFYDTDVSESHSITFSDHAHRATVA